MNNTVRHSGEIKIYKGGEGKGRGYGFITPDNGGADVFFHFTKLRIGINVDMLYAGVRVTYIPIERPTGTHALDVALDIVVGG